MPAIKRQIVDALIILKNIGILLLGCYLANYIILSIFQLGKYVGTFLRILLFKSPL